MRVRVVGAGVIGLSCAVRLREAGLDAHVVAAATGSATTSAAAAALWYPYLVGPADRVRSWASVTFRELVRLAGEPATGVLMRAGVQYLRRPVEPPPWTADLPDFLVRPALVGTPALVNTKVASPYCASWTFTAPVIDTSVYLRWLTDRLGTLGGSVTTAQVATVADAAADADLVVLATGIGARELPGDASVRPVHGQVVRVHASAVRSWVLDDEHPDGLVYVIPRRDDVVCGGVDADGFGPPAPDSLVTERILRRCVEVVPELAAAPVLGAAIGVRPARPVVRLERQGRIVHCYGHGGAGFTLSWGLCGRCCPYA